MCFSLYEQLINVNHCQALVIQKRLADKKHVVNEFIEAHVLPGGGDEEIISRLAFRKINSSNAHALQDVRELERSIVLSLASYMRLRD